MTCSSNPLHARPARRPTLVLAIWLALLVVPAGLADAERARVAAASNFRPAMEVLSEAFSRATSHTVDVSYGATGQIYAQIRHGAPFDLFLAADTDRPARLANTDFGSLDTRTYALGQLALWSPLMAPLSSDSLRNPELRHVAIANPELAPYGAAAMQTLRHFELDTTVSGKLVRGGNVGQAFIFVQTGNAELGFVALSQILSLPEGARGQYWLPSGASYAPIKQDAVLLKRGQENEAAIAFFDYLASEPARAIIADAGYKLP